MIPMETTGCYLKQMHLPRSHPKKKNILIALCHLRERSPLAGYDIHFVFL